MIRFKLNDIFAGGIERLVFCSVEGKPGVATNKRYTFVPGVEYKFSDPILTQYIKGQIGDVREKMVLTPQLKSDLDARQIPYEVVKCGTCSNAKPKAFFNPFVILEDTDENA